MKKVCFEAEKDGFHGAYWKNKTPSNVAIIAMLGDDAEDHMARCGVKWLQKQGVNVLTMSPAKKRLQPSQLSIGEDRKCDKVAQRQWQQRDWNRWRIHHGNACFDRRFLFSGHHFDSRFYSKRFCLARLCPRQKGRMR